jgi:hypothetical protein
MDMAKECSPAPLSRPTTSLWQPGNRSALSTPLSGQSEKEEVSMILKRQRVAKLLQIEILLHKMLALEDTEEFLTAQESLITSLSIPEAVLYLLIFFLEGSYFGQVNEVVEVKEQKRAMDPWIKNLDLGSLLRYFLSEPNRSELFVGNMPC